MAGAAGKLLIHFAYGYQLSPSPPRLIISAPAVALPLAGVTSPKLQSKVLESAVSWALGASPGKDGIVQAGVEDDGGVSLGTMKLPANTNIPLFETLLFQVSKPVVCVAINILPNR